MRTFEQHIRRLSPRDRALLDRARDFINARVPRGYDERMLYDMIGWCAEDKPLLQAAAVSIKRGKIGIRVTRVYGGKLAYRWFTAKSLDELPLDVIGEAIEKMSVDNVRSNRKKHASTKKKPGSTKKKPAKKTKR